MDLISVIVPVYNIEKYLPKCIESIINQTYRNIELILVDDGSTDNSGNICDEYEKKDSRIKVIHKKNGGQGSARNLGLDVAKGDYIAFVDSDDWIADDMYESLLNEITKQNADIAGCGHYIVESGREVPFFTNDSVSTFTTEEALKMYLTDKLFSIVIWDKLYKREIWENIRFPETFREDIYVTYKLLANANKIVHIGVPKYFYLIRKNSSEHTKYKEKFYNSVIAVDMQYKDLSGRFASLEDLLMQWCLNERMSQMRQIIQYRLTKKYAKIFNSMLVFIKENAGTRTEFQNFVHEVENHRSKYYIKIHVHATLGKLNKIIRGGLSKTDRFLKRCNININWRNSMAYLNAKYAIQYFVRSFYRKQENKDKKVNMVFLVTRSNVWNSISSVYEAALKNENINAYLVALPAYKNKKLDLESDVNYDFLKQINPDTIRAYQKEKKEFFDITSLKPDYVIYTIPYVEEYPFEYSFERMSKVCKLCYVSYGFTLVKGRLQELTVRSEVMKCVSYIFTCNKIIYNHYKKFLALSELVSGKRLYNIGFPRFDLYQNVKKTTESGRKTLLWLPRWTVEYNSQVEGNEPSSFFMMKDKILNYASENKDIDVVIRPHPYAFENYISHNMMTETEVDEYKRKIENIPNLTLDTNPSYYDSLINADILIADFTSIIPEFFLMERPIVYFGSDANYPKEFKEMYNSFYQINSWEDAEAALNALISGKDEKKEQRCNAKKRFMKKRFYNTGEKIIEILLKNHTKK